MKGLSILVLLLLAGRAGAFAQTFNHAALDTVLSAHAAASGVRYAALQKDRARLDGYVTRVGAVPAADLERWPRAEQIAFLINAYNALVLQTVIDHYPIKRSLHPAGLLKPANSVWQIPGIFSDRKHRVAGGELTLDDIEHKWLRERLKEPRIHFALVCAAQSCPPLRNEAYVAERLDAQLDDQARRFLGDRSKNQLDVRKGEARLSEILKWFAVDFERFAADSRFAGDASARGVLGFIARYVDPPTATWLQQGKLAVRYIDYDWTLNDAGR